MIATILSAQCTDARVNTVTGDLPDLLFFVIKVAELLLISRQIPGKTGPYEVLCSNWLSFGEICKLKRIEEMVELYYNSNQFTHTLPALEKLFPSPFAMFEKLAEYYEENGYFVNSPSRAYRYGILLDFALCYGGKQEGLCSGFISYTTLKDFPKLS